MTKPYWIKDPQKSEVKKKGIDLNFLGAVIIVCGVIVLAVIIIYKVVSVVF